MQKRKFKKPNKQNRSFNNTIGKVASLIMFFLFVLCGYGLGLFLLLRQGWVLWKQPVIAGVIVGFFMFLDEVNYWPLSWIDYDTADPAIAHVVGKIAQGLVVFVGSSFWYSLSYMAAECLARKAFPNHLQIWQLWKNAGRRQQRRQQTTNSLSDCES